ncbi:hypothetical protein HLB23_24920 [Nocardia uniformis]|uniref:Uncharacterized protein n=1 Tax=Nocardia uniformis TaxID=53432 RepID=A0A849C307_9NOCA|nr:hypothetical protein [Nocardia uniformis]NNH73064.1 hypothetical protein [Nocardia uniformis]
MKRAGPVVTLLAVAALGGGLLLTNFTHGVDSSPTSTAATVAPTSAGAPGVPATTGAPNPGSTAAVFPAQADYVTTVATSSRPLTLSVTVTGTKAVAYVCDGAAVESWLRGTAIDGRMLLTGNNSQIDATPEGENLRGTLALGDRRHDFTAPPVEPPAGLYTARTEGSRDSWIVGPDGSVTGVRRQSDGTTTPAPQLAVDARKVQGDDEF